MSKVRLHYSDEIDDIMIKRLKVDVCKMRMALKEVCNRTMSDISREQKKDVDNGVFYNPGGCYEIHDDIESKSKKINFLDDNNEIVKNAETILVPIINKLRAGNSVASRMLDELLTNNDLRIRISPVPENDAGCEYIPPKSSEKGRINLGFCTGCFADNITEDELAVTIGHEFGHALFEQKIGGNKNIPHIECFEIENFCDIFGSRLAQSAGYNVQARSDYLSKSVLKGDAVHPDWEYRRKINDIFPSNEIDYKFLNKDTVDIFNQYNKELIKQSQTRNVSSYKSSYQKD